LDPRIPESPKENPLALAKPLLERLEKAERDYAELEKAFRNPLVLARPDEVGRLSRALGELEPLAFAARSLKAMRKERAHLEEALDARDPELASIARAELADLEAKEAELNARIESAMLVPQPRPGGAPAGASGAILEIRAGTGGEEAALFAGDMLRMYLRYAERKRWRAEIVGMHQMELGGVREAIVSLEGDDVWNRIMLEGGIHRVQRVPATEASGRIHTSAVSVAALPQAEEVEVQVKPEDLRIDTYCASGPGGQSVNTTYSAVRIVHVPTGIVVQCQDERSQAKNRSRAMKVLRARLLAAKSGADEAARGKVRRSQVGSGDRSEKIRTYNFPQNRVTDHRAGVTLHRLRDVMDGDLDELLDSVARGVSAGDEGGPKAGGDGGRD
jgi:peptide chain release factor 1